jgi:hypothetical protein
MSQSIAKAMKNIHAIPSAVAITRFSLRMKVLLCLTLTLVLCYHDSCMVVNGFMPPPGNSGHQSRTVSITMPLTTHKSLHPLSLMLSKQESEDQYTVERYKNRATLTQSILKEKVGEVKLLKSKIMILQDVVGRLQTESKRELGRRLEDKEVKHSKVLQELQSKLDSTQSLLEAQAQEHSQVVKEFEADITKQQADAAKNQDQEARGTKRLGNRVKALQNEVLDMDQALETTQGELQKVQRRLVAREDEIRLKGLSEERKRKSLEAKVKELEEERESALSKSTLAEELRQESLEIANASVQAAAKREEILQQELNELKESMSILGEEKAQLEALPASGKKGQGLTGALAPKGDQGSTLLYEKNVQLEDKLEKQRLASDIIRKMEQERFDATLQAERRKHEEDLRRLQMRLQRKSEAIGVGEGGLKRIWKRIRPKGRRR